MKNTRITKKYTGKQKNTQKLSGGGVTVVNVLQKHCDIRHARRHGILLLPHKFSLWVSPPS